MNIKRFIYLIIWLLLPVWLQAQTNIIGVEYWFDGQYNIAKKQSTIAATNVTVNDLLDVSSLLTGLHTVTYRFQDNRGIWGAPLIRFFKKESDIGLQKIVALEYWYDNDYDNKTASSFSATSLLNLNEMFNVASLRNGLHFVSLRLKDERNRWNAPACWYFTKNDDETPVLHQLTAQEYWFDGDYSSVHTDPVSATSLLNLDTDLNVSDLNDGVHIVSYRFRDEAGNWSSAFSTLFSKYPADITTDMHELVSVEYWIDGDISSSEKSAIPAGSNYVLNTQLDVSSINDGLHYITYRFQDEAGVWSSAYSELFSKYQDEIVTTNNKITKYRYWADDQIDSALEISLSTPVKSFTLDELVDVSSLPGGTHDITFQFKDSVGLWSSTYTESYTQDYNPRGTITAQTDPACSNSVVTFTAETTDVDSIFWDFGDTTAIVGRAASENAYHAYKNAGDFTVTATFLNLDSAYTNTATTTITVHQSYGVSVVAPENLVAYYPLDGDATDASENGNDGAVNGATPTEDRNGAPNSAYLFDGNDGILIQHSDALNMSEALSFSCWIKPTVLQNAMIFGKSNYTTATNYLLRIQSDGNLQWEYNGFLNTTTKPLEADKWYYIVVTANNPGEHRQIYVNGQLVAETTSSSGPFGSITNPLTIGYASRGAEYFNGAIDELRMYNKVLSPAEIFQLYQGNEGTTLPPIEDEICASEVPYTFGSQLLSTSGTYYETYQTVNGCDSVIQLNLTVHSTYNDTIGQPSDFQVNDDFEIYDVGSLADWTIKYNGTGNANQKVVDHISKNGSKSFQLEGASSWAADLYKPIVNTPEKLTIEAWINVTIGNAQGSGIGLVNYGAASWGARTSRIDFTSGLIRASHTGGTVYNIQPFTPGEWYHVRVEHDMIARVYSVYINGQKVSGTNGSTTTDVFPMYPSAESEDFFLCAGNATTTRVYFDDVKMYEPSDILEICSSETPYIFGNQQISESGTYTETFQSEFGCDSTVTLNLTVHPSYSWKDTLTICEDELPYQWEDSTLIAAGTYTHVYTTVNGCDSIFSFTLNVTDTFLVEQELALCENDLPYTLGAQTLTSSGTFTEIFTGSNGCDSTVVLTLNVLDTSLVSKEVTICESELPYTFGTQSLLTGGNYLEVFTRENGCDSTVMLTLIVSDTFVVADTLVLCENDLPYPFGTQLLLTSGNYTEVFTSANGCDSTVNLAFTANDTFLVRQQMTVCANELPLTLGVQSLTDAGVYTEVFSATSGCDSTVILSLTVNDTFDVADTVSICENNLPYQFGSQELSVDGTYTETFASAAGCDSTVTLVFSVCDTFASFYSDTICENDLPYWFGSQSLTVSGTYVENFPAINGCDSVVTLSLTVHPAYRETINVTVGISQLPYTFGTQQIQGAGIYTRNLQTVNGCDSVIVLNLKVKDDIPPEIVCNPMELTLSADGNYFLTEADEDLISNGSTDNVTPHGNLNIQVSPSFFTCGNLGENTITLSVKDQAGNIASCQTSITVLAAGIQPTIDEIPAVSMFEDESVKITINGISGGTICEARPVTVEANHTNTGLIAELVVSHQPLDSTAELSISLNPDQSGTDTIRVSVEDAFGEITMRKFLLTVIPENDPPYQLSWLNDETMIANDTLGLVLDKNELFGDIDDSTLVFEVRTDKSILPDWIQTDEDLDTYTITFTPAATDTGCVNIVVQGSDRAGASITDTFELCVSVLVGISEIDNDRLGISLYPNPTRGQVTIEFRNPLQEQVELLVLNMAGSELIRKTYQNGEQMIFDISDQSSGTYLVVMHINKKRIVRKLILDKK